MGFLRGPYQKMSSNPATRLRLSFVNSAKNALGLKLGGAPAYQSIGKSFITEKFATTPQDLHTNVRRYIKL